MRTIIGVSRQEKWDAAHFSNVPRHLPLRPLQRAASDSCTLQGALGIRPIIALLPSTLHRTRLLDFGTVDTALVFPLHGKGPRRNSHAPRCGQANLQRKVTHGHSSGYSEVGVFHKSPANHALATSHSFSPDHIAGLSRGACERREEVRAPGTCKQPPGARRADGGSVEGHADGSLHMQVRVRITL